mgnify:CR=1 FL=1
MGNYLHTLSEQVQYFTSKQLWLEGEAILQLEKTAKLPGIKKAIGLPDLHPSRGYPIGAAFFSQSIIYPALVGNDIGCGMALFKTDAKVKELIPDDAHLHNWLDMARERIQFQGLPARICWIGLKEKFNWVLILELS